jgi:hypothetical protein
VKPFVLQAVETRTRFAIALAAVLVAACGGSRTERPAGKCNQGELGCGCYTDNTCGRDVSGALVLCQDGRCVAKQCAAGTEGCTCRGDQSCASAASGAGLICYAGRCVKSNCTPGAPGCPCNAGGICNSGSTCADGFCVPADSAQPPASPVCYTPCQSGLALADGTYVDCPADGLMARCLDGKTCSGGSCADPGSVPPSCTCDVDCPDFQACVRGACYSTCSSNSDCGVGRQCYRHVCRTTCSAKADTCPTNTTCITHDGDSGYCLPTRAHDGAPQLEVAGAFSLSTSTLAFSSSKVSGSLVITNHAAFGLEFAIRKVDHIEFSNSGSTTVTTNPLSWLAMGNGTPSPVQEFKVFVDGNGGTQEVRFANAANPSLPHWQGRMEIANAKLGKQMVFLNYVSRPEGRWTGKMYHFANFDDRGLDGWIANRSNSSVLQAVGNAFIQRWGAFLNGAVSYDEFQAVVTATLNESWKWDSVKKICQGAAACYLYDAPQGYGPYSDSLDAYPIPTAVADLPIGINLQVDAADPTKLVGKIVTSESLQYSGDPQVVMTFQADPAGCKDGVFGACLAPLKSLESHIQVGGRYATTQNDTTCSRVDGAFALAAIPWLVPGFDEGTSLDPSTGIRYRYECRDKALPFGTTPWQQSLNLSLAQSNPIPDGRPRVRRLELVDGALVNQSTLFIIFRERFEESFLGPTDSQGFSSYGFMALTRSPADLDSSAYAGSTVTDPRTPPADLLSASCSPEIIERLLGPGKALDATNAAQVAQGVIEGVTSGSLPAPLGPNDVEKVHYLCHGTGLFDGGKGDDGTTSAIKLPCPVGSGVTFFTATIDQGTIAREPCQETGRCQETLDAWGANRTYGIRLDPVWRCAEPNKAYCETDRLDLRSEKVFYAANQQVVFVPLLGEINDAFRYKTQFRNRQGSSVGFTPEICIPDSNAIPYCYDPPAIEEIRRRVDCALSIFSTYTLDAPTQALLKSFLTANFGYSQDNTVSPPATYDGFEKLNAELLIMLGDEAYTRAFASRFDLAGSRMVSFQGSLFEPNGINLAGGAGNEMYNLYLAAQYYQTVLDRFYALSPYVWQSVQGDVSRNVITKETVVGWFDKLIRASTQKSRAWSEVAKHYQSFNRPDLARHVAERAYSAAYLESIVLSRLMLRVVNVSDPADRAQIVQRAELAALGYRAALLDMRDVYASISDNPTVFGFAPDFIPLPALDPGDVNAFTKMLAAAKQSVALAGTKENIALASNRAFDTDAAQFQLELVRLRNNYEDQLAQLCGTFTGIDGLVHPAIRTYAQLSRAAQYLGDPCGFMGNGQIHDIMGQFEIIALDAKDIDLRYQDVHKHVEIEQLRVTQQCKLVVDLADYKWEKQGKVKDLQTEINVSRATQGTLERVLSQAATAASLQKCIFGGTGGSDCPTGATAAGAFGKVAAAVDTGIASLDAVIVSTERRIADIQRDTLKTESANQCQVLQTDSAATMAKLALEYAHLDLEALKIEYRMKLALAQNQELRNKATRLLAEQEEMEQQTINVAAARNDPNVRIYRNDDVILADLTFQAALRSAYQASKVFEYFTSQSYGKQVQLFLIRMVSHGDYNLESYLQDLENAYREFQQQYGNPDTRVEIISLRDDVMAVPRLDGNGRALTQAERIAEFRRRLADGSYLDEHGYIAMPFSTTLSRLSPLTRNHKALALEAEIVGSDVGDTVGRVYVRQKGTGMVLSVDEHRAYYRFPERTAVLNPFFNGVRAFGSEVYRSDRMRDRPFVNTHWELILNQRDEHANQDINLQSLSDVRLYVYYTDFSEL